MKKVCFAGLLGRSKIETLNAFLPFSVKMHAPNDTCTLLEMSPFHFKQKTVNLFDLLLSFSLFLDCLLYKTESYWLKNTFSASLNCLGLSLLTSCPAF